MECLGSRPLATVSIKAGTTVFRMDVGFEELLTAANLGTVVRIAFFGGLEDSAQNMAPYFFETQKRAEL